MHSGAFNKFLSKLFRPFQPTYQRLLGKHIDVLNKAYPYPCLLYTSDAADERSSVDLGGRRIIKKKTSDENIDSQRI